MLEEENSSMYRWVSKGFSKEHYGCPVVKPFQNVKASYLGYLDHPMG
jgi:hypothetical protein